MVCSDNNMELTIEGECGGSMRKVKGVKYLETGRLDFGWEHTMRYIDDVL